MSPSFTSPQLSSVRHSHPMRSITSSRRRCSSMMRSSIEAPRVRERRAQSRVVAEGGQGVPDLPKGDPGFCAARIGAMRCNASRTLLRRRRRRPSRLSSRPSTSWQGPARQARSRPVASGGLTLMWRGGHRDRRRGAHRRGSRRVLECCFGAAPARVDAGPDLRASPGRGGRAGCGGVCRWCESRRQGCRSRRHCPKTRTGAAWS